MNTLPRQENNFWHQSTEPIPEQLPMLEANEFLPHIGKWTTIGVGVVLSIFVAGVALTSVLKYNVTVKVPATIRPVGDIKLVQSLISGKIEKIAVTENQTVAPGEAIAYIDSSRLQNQKSQLTNVIQQSQLQFNKIDAQLREIDTQIAAQTNLNSRIAIAAQAELSGAQRNYTDQQITAMADMGQAQAALTLARVQRDRLQRENLLKATIQETTAALELAKAQRDRLQREKLLTTNIQEAETALKLAREQRDRLQREKLLTATVGETEAALELAKAQRDRLQREKLLTKNIQEAEAALNLAIVQRNRMQPIVASGAIARNVYEEKEQAVISAEVKLEQAKANAKNLLEEKVQAVISAEAKLEQAKANAKNLLEEKEQAVISAEAKLEQAKANAKNLLEEKEQAVISAEAKLEQAKANAKNLLEEKEQALTTAQTNVVKANTALNPSNAPVTVASERIKQEQAKGEATLAALNKERETLLQQRLQFQTQLDRTRKELQQTDNDINQSVIRAPIAGTVLQLNLRNSGQVVQPSEAIAQIAPINAPILIKANIQSQDVNKVKPGQQVQMRVSACPYPDYGTLRGTVKTIAPDALPIANNTSLPSPPKAGYEVIIEPQTPYVGRGARQCQLKSGMEGQADIISRQETVLHFILRKARLIADM
ncbi:HlyD family efflux transporter periplasmic adaptor subunit [Nostoc sp. UHCC 0870]|uniref:HlyD family efflux transporter periplasmic adaptor subunit n=1 Tax=Nostoc sp. UHCC 0870 TaxID=2914041 RepID=UPI001EE11787|nr:HlyD family efflux transporter periplasmic adaptor subunit [Nostoc sp. UHCC 0870]UKO99922.1 HlyD family efflux transporter periplasmic adaptor subunit [Nostoc sp. UHCC 0870]